ncbi:hypothetical protein NIIDMKKI_53430 [Mycobacterium kansasii]|uniref:DUF222 domain-containing protein n=1 Tax=Mycobacterium kansasii TaxID=1768 RepID=A0A7G1IH20_MYCKA|nr:hypothetical protein NIIDMKKI_53430 [Mycobacterium kansasii]
MSASTREEIVAVLDASDDAQDQLCELTFDALTTPELLRVVERLERRERRSRSVRHALINQLRAQASEDDLGGKLPRRWPSGCASPKPKPTAGSPRPRTSETAAR